MSLIFLKTKSSKKFIYKYFKTRIYLSCFENSFFIIFFIILILNSCDSTGFVFETFKKLKYLIFQIIQIYMFQKSFKNFFKILCIQK